MQKVLLAFAGAMALLTGSALADGMERKPACCETAGPWTGFYLGVGGGAGAVVHNITVPGLGFDGIGGEGMFGTVIAGYDRMIAPGVVVGIFADYDFSNISTDLTLGGFSATVDHKSTWSIGGRLGILSSPSTLWYGVGGFTQAKFGISSSIGSLDLPDFNGYFVGAGVESQIRGGWSMRAEYRFSQFGNEEVAGIVGVEPSMHTARMALTYKWGRDEPMREPMK